MKDQAFLRRWLEEAKDGDATWVRRLETSNEPHPLQRSRGPPTPGAGRQKTGSEILELQHDPERYYDLLPSECAKSVAIV